MTATLPHQPISGESAAIRAVYRRGCGCSRRRSWRRAVGSIVGLATGSASGDREWLASASHSRQNGISALFGAGSEIHLRRVDGRPVVVRYTAGIAGVPDSRPANDPARGVPSHAGPRIGGSTCRRRICVAGQRSWLRNLTDGDRRGPGSPPRLARPLRPTISEDRCHVRVREPRLRARRLGRSRAVERSLLVPQANRVVADYPQGSHPPVPVGLLPPATVALNALDEGQTSSAPLTSTAFRPRPRDASRCLFPRL